MTPPCPKSDQPEPDLLRQLFLEMSSLDLAKDRATLLELYKRVRTLMMEIIQNEPHPAKYTSALQILQSADIISAELSEELDLTAFRRLKEHIREANYNFQ